MRQDRCVISGGSVTFSPSALRFAFGLPEVSTFSFLSAALYFSPQAMHPKKA